MRVLCPAAIGVYVLLVGHAAAARHHKTDMQKLQGTWRLVAMEERGIRIAREDPRFWRDVRLIFKGDRVFLAKVTDRGIIETCESSYRLDATRRPKAMDIFVLTGERKGDVQRAIYEFENGVLRMCVDEDGKGRPTTFGTKPRSGLILMSLKRQQEKD